MASAGVFVYACIPFYTFFNVDRGLYQGSPRNDYGHGLMAFLCIYLGLNPGHLYGILRMVKFVEKASFYYTYIKSFDKVVTVLQMLLSPAVFFILLPLLKRTSTISIDFDWFYRKGAKLFYDAMDKTTKAAERLIKTLLPAIAQFVIVAPAIDRDAILRCVWQESLDADEKSLKKREEELIAGLPPVHFLWPTRPFSCDLYRAARPPWPRRRLTKHGWPLPFVCALRVCRRRASSLQ